MQISNFQDAVQDSHQC